ncbi:Holliday junction branch migration protein RuvA [Flavobacterium oreochromis]|uniref:Holliday junction branch migration complex subunit RuvA n=2 Tax=Flavobacterium TaxID=237 RepID=A0A246GD79_9FLAO|nr:Holliday junction branch migration protein RuvA [Flavobacterium oreochromis]OWP74835.1 Holliday junction branch migration protein RuvA [Flavobacterium oreochromis]OWP79235.1 Holliday junction branch migration protein RuvA [Flavobacterium oreochromis]POR30501.1 Holliday junction branch migration protein RuvA [Flavobacterium columnare]QYS86962.1 Holliday junction branch migration protein RuvA [Flavobacterium oreochromis]
MIAHIQGKLVEKNPTDVVIDCNGVGYLIHISLHTYGLLPSNDFVKLYTYLQVKEDSHSLYGFMEKSEREIFKLLISVSGIGANTARTMLSSLEPKQIINALASENVSTIQSIKGIGIKTAQRAIIELKDKVLKIYEIDEVSLIPNNTNKDEALSALEVLGFVRKSAEKVVEKIIASTPEATVENIIKQALKNL